MSDPTPTDAAETSTTEKPTVHQALVEARGIIGSISKGGSANEKVGGYNYRGIEQLINGIAPALFQVGITIAPRVIEQHFDPNPPNRKPGWTLVRLTVAFDVYGPTGDTLEHPIIGIGYGLDNGDKGPGKAMSYAYKTAIGQLLCIPTDASLDNENYDPAQSNSTPITPGEAAEIRSLFDEVEEADRKEAKRRWGAIWGTPDLVDSENFSRAYNDVIRICDQVDSESREMAASTPLTAGVCGTS